MVDFKTNVSACSWIASPYFPAPPGAPLFGFAIGVPAQPTQVNVRTVEAQTVGPVFADSNFTVQVLC